MLTLADCGRLIRQRARRGEPARYVRLFESIRLAQPKTLVEVGVWRGTTGKRMIRESLRFHEGVQYWGFDLFAENSSADVIASESGLWPDPVETVREYMSTAGADITLVPGNTRVTLPIASLPPIDFVYLDGGHSFETITADWTNIQRYLHPGSVIVIDDYTNRLAEKHGNFGVRTFVRGLDRFAWRVESLRPIDVYRHDWGYLRTQMVRVTRR